MTTRVGQAADLVRHGENGWMVEPEDVDGLVGWTARVAGASEGEPAAVLERGHQLSPLAPGTRPCGARWRALLDGLVASGNVIDVGPARVGRYQPRRQPGWARLAVGGRPVPGVRVFYGHDRVPGPGERAAGGTVKMQKLAERVPEHTRRLLAALPRDDVASAATSARSSPSYGGAASPSS